MSIIKPKLGIKHPLFAFARLEQSQFDSEGVKTVDREIIQGGELQTYLLASYAARKMNMTPTGHAGGIHNWLVEQTHNDLQYVHQHLMPLAQLYGKAQYLALGLHPKGGINRDLVG